MLYIFFNSFYGSCCYFLGWGRFHCWLFFPFKIQSNFSVLDIQLNWIWNWGFTHGPLGHVEYPFIAITLWSILTPKMLVPVTVLSIGQIEIFNHLQYLEPFNCVQTINSNTWNHLAQSAGTVEYTNYISA